MAGTSRKVSAASARVHTRKSNQRSGIFASFLSPSGILRKIAVVLVAGIIAWICQTIQPPPPKLCGSPDGPPITASRIKLSDGRHLAYKEHGISKDKAKYKIVNVHGFDSCRHDALPLSLLLNSDGRHPDIPGQRPGFKCWEMAEELGVYLVSFDRPGYGESDPHPKRTPKSIALDIAELADKLELGSKFYVIGFSMGGQVVWGCLKYIPDRLAGAALLAPVVNYWWPGLPSNLSKQAFNQQRVQDQFAVGVAHYFPWLTYWWNTRKWLPASSVIAHSIHIFSPQDRALLPNLEARKHYAAQIRQQGDFETLHRDMIVGFGSWEFGPTDIKNPFPNNEGSVHLWHGDQDWIVPVDPQRYFAEKLPWIHYHELPGAGHMFPIADGFGDSIVKVLVLGEQ